jgi:hypothetical protein
MNNHIHLILQPTTKEGLQKVLKPLHMRYSQYINKQQNITGILLGLPLFLKLKSLPTLSLSFRIKPSLPHGKPLCVFIFKVLSC